MTFSKKGVILIKDKFFRMVTMKTLIQILTDKASVAFTECGYSGELGTVSVSDRPDLCQFQCNGAFSGAKLYHKAPRMIADDVVKRLSDDPTFSKTEVVGAGFINLNISDEFLLEHIKGMLEDADLGIPQAQKAETIVLDYGGPNIAKPLHVGHLRSAVIGESVKRIAQAVGHRTISDIHLGDWGLQIGLVIAELSERYPDWDCFKDGFNPDSFDGIPLTPEQLYEVYPFASAKSKTDEAFKQKARQITADLQKGDKVYNALRNEIVKVTTPDVRSNYQNLNVSLDLWLGESDSAGYIPTLIEKLNEKGMLYESDGALVANVSQSDDKVEIPPIIIVKSDGSYIYATTDLATLIQRQEDFDPDEVWYVVDARQSLHFTQVFRCAKKAEIVGDDTKLVHIGYGTMNGSDGKPYKTRDGGVMRLSDFYNTVYNAALERISDSKFSRDEEKEDIARKITVAAIKFGDLINYCMKDYVFDIDRFLAPDGKTGSFLLYTVARVNSLFYKTEFDYSFDSKEIYTDVERELLIKIALSPEAYLLAFREKAPSVICENAYQLASQFSKFYHDNHILTEENPDKRKAWLNVCFALKSVLEKQLDVLGIESVDLM